MRDGRVRATSGHDPTIGTTTAPGSTTSLDSAARALFRSVARARSDRALHPLGRVHRATLDITADRERLPSVDILQATGTAHVLVRLSRGAGLPAPAPDVLGLALRWPDRYGTGAHQDLLLASSADLPLLNHLLVPRRSLAGAQLSSLLPYEVRGRRLLFGARVASDDGAVASMRGSYSGLGVELMLGTRFGRFHPIGLIVLGEPVSPRVNGETRFDPWNTAPDIRPAGFWNRVRHAAYAGSRAGFTARQEGP